MTTELEFQHLELQEIIVKTVHGQIFQAAIQMNTAHIFSYEIQNSGNVATFTNSTEKFTDAKTAFEKCILEINNYIHLSGNIYSIASIHNPNNCTLISTECQDEVLARNDISINVTKNAQ
jgi:hypothetical protein